MNELDSEKSTQKLIDELMRVLNTYGLATDSAGYEIVTQIFLYKFLNDTFIKSSKNTLSIENNIQLYEKLEEINEAEEKELFIKNTKHKNFDKRYLSICQVSADTPKQAITYQEMGAKTFRVALPKDKLLKGEKVCLSETKGTQCARCMLCNGVKQNIVIAVHGSRQKRFKSNLIA